jgi:hypothetical protein
MQNIVLRYIIGVKDLYGSFLMILSLLIFSNVPQNNHDSVITLN